MDNISGVVFTVEHFEKGCLCLMDGRLKRFTRGMAEFTNSDESYYKKASDYYLEKCTCSRNFGDSSYQGWDTQPTDIFDYINNHYGLSVSYHSKLLFSNVEFKEDEGRFGVVIGVRNQYLKVYFMDHDVVEIIHPTWGVKHGV